MTNPGAKLKRCAELISAASFALMFGAFMIQIVSRYVFDMPVSWSLDLKPSFRIPRRSGGKGFGY